MRTEVILLRKWAKLDVPWIEQFVNSAPAWADKLNEDQRAAIEVVLAHLRNDLDCNPLFPT